MLAELDHYARVVVPKTEPGAVQVAGCFATRQSALQCVEAQNKPALRLRPHE